MPVESEKSSKKAKSSSSNIRHSSNYLPLDLWASIIVNLPVKTLLIFRCVCKSWCSIIDHPDFGYTNLKLRKIDSKKSKIFALEGFRYQGARRCLLTVRQGDTLRKTAHIFESSDRYYLVGRCNELLLLRRFVYPGDFNPGYEKEMRLWNPSIRKSLLIPPCPLVNAIYLLGFAPLSKDYKIIAIDNNINRPKNYSYIAVYTLSDQQWCVRNNDVDVNCSYKERIYVPPTAFYFQGAAHWFGRDPLVENEHQYELTHLVSFNFDSEKFTFLEIPRDSKGTDIARFLFILGELLAIFSVTRGRSRIWVLEQGSGKGVWTNWFSGRSNSDTYYLFSTFWSYSLLFYETDGERYFIFGKKSYNIASGRVEELEKSMSNCLDLGMYMESLVLWKGYGAEDMASFP
ncbi:F-box/kelch-repeat protein At3g23880-like [Silene latifolia]|uniref:F-box/kelch-repeat protein At3g23880-like n=1 Tax=Silene latifolia TaxID=37657 RepID=UPI003D779FEF